MDTDLAEIVATVIVKLVSVIDTHLALNFRHLMGLERKGHLLEDLNGSISIMYMYFPLGTCIPAEEILSVQIFCPVIKYVRKK
jgi:hypothetical protein